MTRKQAAEADAVTARAAQAAAAVEAAALEPVIADRTERHRALADELRAHDAAAAPACVAVAPADDDRLARAEESFARAKVAGEKGGGTARGLAKLQNLRADRAVADELARLKAEAGSPPSRRRRA